MVNAITIRGAREHNLKNIDVSIPKNTLTVITGLSGSGKSSLAFDTIYAEGQRRYVESLSAYARQFLNMASKPDVDHIDGLSPAIAIDQKTTSRNPRSIVGTITEVYDYLRLLYANVGRPHCPTHNIPIEAQTVSQMVDAVMQWPEGTRMQIVAPVVRGRKGEYKKDILNWQKQGYQRIRIDGEKYDIAETPDLDKNIKHTIDIIVDRMVVREDNQNRLADSLETALKLAGGMAVVEPVAKGDEKIELEPLTFSEKHTCPTCGHVVPDLEPRLFSFNSPYGACQTCDGLGDMIYFAPELIIPDESKSLAEGAVKPWVDTRTNNYYAKAIANHYGFNINTAYQDLPEEIKEVILYGSGSEVMEFVFKPRSGGMFRTNKPFEGAINILERQYTETESNRKREQLEKYRASAPCPDCHGNRLNKDALAVTVNGFNIMDLCALPVKDALTVTQDLQEALKGNRATIAAPILREITSRLGFLYHVGLGYLSLTRKSGTLSGGESQRIRLASQIGSGLTGVLYVLDEPSIGLHQRDNNKLLNTLQQLKQLDNTILVVEHDEDAIRTADHVIDIGPGAGEHGGKIVAEGTAKEIQKNEKSLTGQYLAGKRAIDVPVKRRKGKKGKKISIMGANGNNLKNVDVDIPLGMLTCVTGVSGSGKSTLVMDTLTKAVSQKLNKAKEAPAPYKELKGLENLDKIVNIDQSPIGRTPRSNPATYTGVMSPIRDWFAKLPDARARGYTPGRFSFNVKGGRCEACQGDGLIKVEMHFLADVYVPCDVCHGKRYNRETLEIMYKGKSIADVLDMPVESAFKLFEAVPAINKRLKTLMDVGLGYIRLGQSATTLSGGEAQRVKLSKELSKRSTGKTLYILDEPTTGLHFYDIEQLLKVLHRLVDEGNTMVVIEHNLDVIKTADNIIDIGPEGGDGGGEIIATGTPEDVAQVKASHTGHYLKEMLKKEKDVA